MARQSRHPGVPRRESQRVPPTFLRAKRDSRDILPWISVMGIQRFSEQNPRKAIFRLIWQANRTHLDRIVHNAYRLELDGPSMRKLKAAEGTQPPALPAA